MCRLFAVRSENPVRVARAFEALKVQALEHKDGWGIARFDAQTPQVEVNVAPAHACPRFAALGETLETSALITHIRLASVGSVTESNAHPFVAGTFAFMHNGTVTEFRRHRAAISERVAPHHLAAVRGETDSELCFALFRTELDKLSAHGTDALCRALSRVVSQVAQLTDTDAQRSAMNFLVTDGVRFAATRRGRSLFVTSEPSAHFIASERLWDGEWHEVPEEGVIAIDERLGLRATSLSDWN